MLRKLLLFIVVPLGILILLFYFTATGYIETYSREGLQLATQYMQRSGLGTGRLSFANVQFSSPRSVLWKELRGNLQVRTGKDVIELFVAAKEVELWLQSLSLDRLTLEVRDFSFRPNRIISRGEDEQRATRIVEKLRQSAFQGKLFRLRLLIDPLHPQEAIESTIHEMVKLAKGEPAAIDADLIASLSLVIGDTPLRGRLTLTPRGEGVGLTLDENDVNAFARQAKDELTDDEIRIVAQNPFRAGELMSIKSYAVRRARELSKLDPKLPEDAYRHVLWSYLLTKRFQSGFAQEVTDAHEAKQEVADYFDREMDLINNRIGRIYAQRNYTEEELAHYVKTDPDVVHTISGEH
ncbi:MAG: hypothetical protein KDD55_12385 [Bdellovibrionales bacterium]|nr:hypothetical protein [Bdellovibrionales bacterium]